MSRVTNDIVAYEMLHDKEALNRVVEMYINSGRSEAAIEDIEAEIDESWCAEQIYLAIDRVYGISG